MTYLLFAIFAYAALFTTFKFFDRYNINATFAVTLNYLVATVAGLFYRNFAFSIPQVLASGWFPMAAVVGFLFVAGFLLIAISTRKVGVALTVVAGKMSVIIPVIVGFFMLNEPFTTLKIFGICIALLAFYTTFRDQSGQKVSKYFIFLPFLIFLGNGLGDSLMKLSGIRFPGRSEVDFLIAVFAVAFLFGVIILAYQLVTRKQQKYTWKDLAAGLWLGVLNWVATYTFLKALTNYPISFFIPVFNASVVALVALVGSFLLGEKLKWLNWLGIALAIVAIVLITAS